MKKRPVLLGLSVLVVFALGSGPAPADAGSLLGPELTISIKDRDQGAPRVAYNSLDDEYLVVWEEAMVSGIREIFGRRIGGDGTVYADFAIAAGDGVDRIEPDVAYDPVKNRYLVVYGKDMGVGGVVWNIWGRIIPALGPDPLLTEDYLGLSLDSQLEPAVTYGRGPVVAEKFLVVWIEDPSPTPVIDQVYAAFVEGATGIADNQFAVTTGATNCDEPEIAYNRSRSEFLVTFMKDGDLKGKILNAGGTAVHGGAFTIASPGTGFVESNGGVSAYFPGDRYLAVYQVDQFTDIDIGAQWVSGDATLLGGGLPFPDAGLIQRDPEVDCIKNSGHCLIVWTKQYTNSTGPFGLWAALAPKDGGLMKALEVIEPSPFDKWREYSAVAGGATPFFVAWQHERDSSVYEDIHGRLVAPLIFFDGFESGDTSMWSTVVP